MARIGLRHQIIVSEFPILHYKKIPDYTPRLEPSTCTEAETFALQVLDNSMEPEFRDRCIIVVDPTGHATHGSYVLAKQLPSNETGHAGYSSDPDDLLESFLFRQLRRNEGNEWVLHALNESYPELATSQDLSGIVGVIVQRAGTRRRYHKRYD